MCLYLSTLFESLLIMMYWQGRYVLFKGLIWFIGWKHIAYEHLQFVLWCESIDITVTLHIHHNISHQRVWGVLVPSTIGGCFLDYSTPLYGCCVLGMYVCVCQVAVRPSCTRLTFDLGTAQPYDLTLCVLMMIIPSHSCSTQLHKTCPWPGNLPSCATQIFWPGSGQPYDTDIWPGHPPSHTTQTFDLGISPVAWDRHWDRQLDGRMTWELMATRLDYMSCLCVSILDPKGSGPCETTKLTTPIQLW